MRQNLSKQDEAMRHIRDKSEELIATPELIVETLQRQFPDSLPSKPTKWEQFARLQGQQDVIRYLDGLINNAK